MDELIDWFLYKERKEPVTEPQKIEPQPKPTFDKTGWREMLYFRPKSDDAPIELMRDSWETPSVSTLSDLNPYTNAVGLYWRAIDTYSQALHGFCRSGSTVAPAQDNPASGPNAPVGPVVL